MEYRLPAPIDRRHEWASSLITLFRDNGYHLEFFSFPERLNANHFDLIALPLTLNATSPEAMDHLIFEKLQAPLLSDPVESSMSVRSYPQTTAARSGYGLHGRRWAGLVGITSATSRRLFSRRAMHLT